MHRESKIHATALPIGALHIAHCWLDKHQSWILSVDWPIIAAAFQAIVMHIFYPCMDISRKVILRPGIPHAAAVYVYVLYCAVQYSIHFMHSCGVLLLADVG